jgi:nickel/cobalt transporter (NicO) family protein
MDGDIAVLAVTAASVGFLHTLFGPDHYLPFIVMSRARGWSTGKTALITSLCGLGHVLSSVALGLIGIAIGIGVGELEAVEGFRGGVAAWLLIGFGLAYMVWGLRRAAKDKAHSHAHAHNSDDHHVHTHSHNGEHTHVHHAGGRSLTPWVLFTIFVFGPCEPLIPILMYPAAKHSIPGMVLVALVFSVVTIATMSAIVLLGVRGSRFARLGKLERFSHALAGGAICASGLAIQFLGL